MNGRLIRALATSLSLMGASTLALATPPLSRPATPSATPAHAVQPLGANILFDQLGTETNGIAAQIFTDLAPLNADLADDFTITDSAGWTVTSVVVQQDVSALVSLSGIVFNVNIYPDDNGAPGAVAECSLDGVVPTYDATNTLVTLATGSDCYLGAGTWWLSATPVMNRTDNGQLFSAFGDPGVALGAQPEWRNPNGGWGGACVDWTPVFTCADVASNGYTATNDMLFRIVGQTGGDPGRITLTVGLAEATDDPTACGTSTDLQATAGDLINFCYTITNTLPYAMNFQSLEDTVVGSIFFREPVTVLPGASYQYNRVITATASETPISTWTASDSLPTFAPGAGSYNYVEISATGDLQPVGNTDDGVADVTMPFAFAFANTTSDVLCISNNGVIVFGGDTGCDANLWNDWDLPYAGLGAFIAPFWMDLNSGGNIYTQTLGVAPNRQFLIEYSDKNSWSGSSTPGYTFEVIFNEGGSIDFDYATVTSGGDPSADGGLDASIGLQWASNAAYQFSFETASVSDGQNIHWIPSQPVSRHSLATVTLDVGAPILFAVPTPLAGTAVEGTTTSDLLYLTNNGNRDLLWTLADAPPASHFPLVPTFDRLFAHPTPASAGIAPDARTRQSAGSLLAPLGAAGIPAYGVAFYPTPLGPTYIDFDASAPGVLATIAPLPQQVFAAAFVNNDFSKEYVVDEPAHDLYTIDTSDGTLTLIGNTGIPEGQNALGLRWDSTTGQTFLTTTLCQTSSTLYSLDLDSGAATSIGTYTADGNGSCIVSIAIDAAGLMYGIDVYSDTLVALDKTTGAGADIGGLGFDANYAQGLDFDANTGILYLAGYGTSGNMYTVDVRTGHASLIAPLGNGTQVAAFAIATVQNVCARPADVPWMTPDATSGTAAPGSFSTVTLSLDATSLEPGVYDATLCLHSNDLDAATTAIPVEFTVTAASTNDIIFANGFDAN